MTLLFKPKPIKQFLQRQVNLRYELFTTIIHTILTLTIDDNGAAKNSTVYILHTIPITKTRCAVKPSSLLLTLEIVVTWREAKT